MRAFGPKARRITQRRYQIGVSARPGGHVERLTIRNASSRARSFYVSLEVANGNRLDAGYVLRAARG
jgi:hypothetical protein